MTASTEALHIICDDLERNQNPVQCQGVIESIWAGKEFRFGFDAIPGLFDPSDARDKIMDTIEIIAIASVIGLNKNGVGFALPVKQVLLEKGIAGEELLIMTTEQINEIRGPLGSDTQKKLSQVVETPLETPKLVSEFGDVPKEPDSENASFHTFSRAADAIKAFCNKKRKSPKSPKSSQNRRSRKDVTKAIKEAQMLLAERLGRGEHPTLREIAEAVEVSPSTLSRSKEYKEFEAKIHKANTHFNRD